MKLGRSLGVKLGRNLGVKLGRSLGMKLVLPHQTENFKSNFNVRV